MKNVNFLNIGRDYRGHNVERTFYCDLPHFVTIYYDVSSYVDGHNAVRTKLENLELQGYWGLKFELYSKRPRKYVAYFQTKQDALLVKMFDSFL